MPTFNNLQEKLIKVYISNKDEFTREELESLFKDLVKYKKDGSEYTKGVYNSRMTTLNKRLINEGINVLAPQANQIVTEWREDIKNNPIQEKKEEEKLEFSMEDINSIREPYIEFLKETDKYRKIYNDKKNRKKRNELITLINNNYALLQINSGVRINELIQGEFNIHGDSVMYIQSKSKASREFIPLWVTSKDWLSILDDTRKIVGKESVTAVNKRYNEYLNKNHETIKKSHDLRKVYLHFNNHKENPLGHRNENMKKIYNVMKPKDDEVKIVEEIKNEIQQRNDIKRCDMCLKDILKKNWSRHIKTKKHQQNN